jgi:hypothetical protein
LAIPCLFNAFLFYYDMTVAALSVINNETVGTNMERRVLLLLCGAPVWYRGFQARFYYSKIFSPERNILMPNYERASEGGIDLEDGHHGPRHCIQEW